MKKYFRNMSLVKKATLISILFIILPTFFFATFLYYQQTQRLYTQAYEDRKLATEQLADNIETTLVSIKDLSLTLSYRSPVTDLIGRKNLSKYPLYTKRTTEDILTALKYTLLYESNGIQNVCIFTDNPELKDVDYFYQDSLLQSFAFYQDFRQLDKINDVYYLSPDTAALYYVQKNVHADSSHGLLLMVRDIIYSQVSDYNGLLICEVNPSVLFSQLSDYVNQDDGYTLYFNNLQNTYGSTFPDTLKQVLQDTKDQHTALSHNGQVHLFQSLESYDVFLVDTSGFSRAQYALPASKISILLVLIACVQFFILRAFLHNILNRINANITEMDQIIANNFSGSIPITSADEISLISQRYNTLLAKTNTLIADIVHKETDSKDAQIKALQYQINPHFLYNTLSIFAGNAEQTGNHELSEAISYFGHLLRYNIKDTGPYSTVALEIQNAYSLIHVYSLRYRGTLHLNVYVPEHLNTAKMIKYLLQPLLENAIFHGKRNVNENITIEIILEYTDTQMLFKIYDDGIGMTPERLKEVKDHILYGSHLSDTNNSNSSFIGLHNVYKRLLLVYGKSANLEIESVYNEGTCVNITLPLIKETGEM